MGFKSQDKIKQEIIETIKGAKNFDGMMDKIAVYIQANYVSKLDQVEIVEPSESENLVEL